RFVFLERVRAMKHPDIAVRIRGRSPDTAEQHAVRHGWEAGVNLEHRQHRARARFLLLSDGDPLEFGPAEKGYECDRCQRCAREDVSIHVTAPSSNEHLTYDAETRDNPDTRSARPI